MTEFIDWFSNYYDALFMTVPAFKTVIFIVTAICTVFITNNVLKIKTPVLQYTSLILLSLLLMFIPMLPASALKVWLYYFPNQVFLFYISASSLQIIKKNPEKYTAPSRQLFKKILKVTLFFSILIVLEDTFVIFSVDVYTDILVRINNRNVSEDILSIFYAVCTIRYFFNLLVPADTINFSAHNNLSINISTTNEKKILDSFYTQYDFTTREQDILNKILQDKNNQEISDELYISIGTVKSHIHNIFQKLDITKRNQIFSLYQEFLNENKEK